MSQLYPERLLKNISIEAKKFNMIKRKGRDIKHLNMA